MALKIALLALLVIAFVYFVYRASDWYFTKKDREDRFEMLKRARQHAQQEAIWADDDPETFDRERFERELREMGIEPDLADTFAGRLERGEDLNIELEDL